MMKYSAGPLTGQLKPKYRVITMALGEEYKPTNGVDVYIDLGSLIKSMGSSKKYMNSLPFSTDIETDLVYSILTTFKHWKDYTRKWDNVRIIMMSNDLRMEGLAEQSVLKSYLVPYNCKYESEAFSMLKYHWVESLKKVGVVLNYIPNGYLVTCKRFDSYVLPEIVSDKKRDRIIVTGDPFYTSHFYMKNTKVIYTRFSQYGLSQISDPLMIVHSVSHIDDDIMQTFTNNRVFYNTLQLFIGCKDRAIQGIQRLGITEYASDLIRAIEQRKIPSDPKSVESILPAVNPQYHDYIKKNYPLIDIEEHAKLVTPSMVNEVKSGMIDLLDVDGLSKLSIEGMNLLELF